MVDSQAEANKDVSDALWRIGDVARYLRLSRNTVRRRMRDSDLPFRRIGGVIRFLPAEVEAWAASQQDQEVA